MLGLASDAAEQKRHRDVGKINNTNLADDPPDGGIGSTRARYETNSNRTQMLPLLPPPPVGSWGKRRHARPRCGHRVRPLAVTAALPRRTEWPWMNGVTRCRTRGDGAPRLQHTNLAESHYCQGSLVNIHEANFSNGRLPHDVGRELINIHERERFLIQTFQTVAWAY